MVSRRLLAFAACGVLALGAAAALLAPGTPPVPVPPPPGATRVASAWKPVEVCATFADRSLIALWGMPLQIAVFQVPDGPDAWNALVAHYAAHAGTPLTVPERPIDACRMMAWGLGRGAGGPVAVVMPESASGSVPGSRTVAVLSPARAPRGPWDRLGFGRAAPIPIPRPPGALEFQGHAGVEDLCGLGTILLYDAVADWPTRTDAFLVPQGPDAWDKVVAYYAGRAGKPLPLPVPDRIDECNARAWDAGPTGGPVLVVMPDSTFGPSLGYRAVVTYEPRSPR